MVLSPPSAVVDGADEVLARALSDADLGGRTTVTASEMRVELWKKLGANSLRALARAPDL